MSIERGSGFNPEEIKKTTTKEDLEHLAEVAKKTLEEQQEQEEVALEPAPQPQVELGKAFDEVADKKEELDTQSEQPVTQKGDEKVKLGKAFE